MANERTFLAWIRTSLALVAAGVAVEAIHLSWSESARRAVAATLVVLGAVLAGASWWRWAASERALRRDGPLPSAAPVLGLMLSVGVLAIAVVLLAVGL